MVLGYQIFNYVNKGKSLELGQTFIPYAFPNFQNEKAACKMAFWILPIENANIFFQKAMCIPN